MKEVILYIVIFSVFLAFFIGLWIFMDKWDKDDPDIGGHA